MNTTHSIDERTDDKHRVTGGASTGGAFTGGASTGGASTGGASTGGASTGGASTGGASTGGALKEGGTGKEEGSAKEGGAAKEGGITKRIEQTTAAVPSATFLVLAGGAIAGSLVLKLMGRHSTANFVGEWVPTILMLGLYNKIVKVLGSERAQGAQGA